MFSIRLFLGIGIVSLQNSVNGLKAFNLRLYSCQWRVCGQARILHPSYLGPVGPDHLSKYYK